MLLSSSKLRNDKLFSIMKSVRSWAHKINPSDFWASSWKITSWFPLCNLQLNRFSNKKRMSFKFSSSLGSSSRGCRPFKLSQILISGRVVTRNRIQSGSLLKHLAITSSNSLRPWYSLSSKASIITRQVELGSVSLLSGSSNSNSNRSPTSMSLISTPKFLDSCFTRALL